MKRAEKAKKAAFVSKNIVVNFICKLIIGFVFLMTHKYGNADQKNTQTIGVIHSTVVGNVPDSLGFAGGFAGSIGKDLIFAGGANFPEKMPWEGGTKVWSKNIYLQKNKKTWDKIGEFEHPLGYGVSASVGGNLIVVGGSDSTAHYSNVTKLGLINNKLTSDSLPALPTTLANSAGAVIGTRIYIVGGTETPDSVEASSRVYVLDTAKLEAGWETIDGPTTFGRILPVVVPQDGRLFIFSGASLSAGSDGKPVRKYLTDSWVYDRDEGWKQLKDIPLPAVAAPAFSTDVKGNFHIVILGGDDGTLVNFKDPAHHPGFPGTVQAYHAITNTWVELGRIPNSVVTAPVVKSGNKHLVMSGEVKPGVRSPEVKCAELIPKESSFGIANWFTLILYLLVILGVGFYCSDNGADTNEFFRGGQKIPWWAAGISIFATTLSSITFMAMPAKAYSENWVFILANVPILLLAPFIVYMIVPVFRRIDATSAYEYLERRFNIIARIFGSASFLLFQLGRMAVVLFLPALALATVTDININICIILMGLLTIVYCVMGGVTAVIWTDVIQAFVFLGGALVTLGLIVWNSGGVGNFVGVASAADKFHTFNWTWDYTVASVWVIIIGNLFSNLIPYTSDQGIVQRYMTTSDEKKSAQAVWLNAIIAIPATVLFFAVGTGIYVYYVNNPQNLTASLQTDAIFPLFIAHELPVGIAGLVVAGIFAVAQSTVSTSINSMSTVVVVDYYERFSHIPPSEKQKMKVARISTAVWGVFGTVAALMLAGMDIKSLWDLFLQLLGLTGGALAGLFMLGIFTTRANGIGAIVGAFASVIILSLVQSYTQIHFFLYAMIGIISCFVIGYGVSVLTGKESDRSLDGLTIFSLKNQNSSTSENELAVN